MSNFIRGISFPFRVGIKGGIALSEARPDDVPHLNESIDQLLGTFPYERTMEYHLYSELQELLFEQDNEELHPLLKYYVVRALSSDPRISLTEENVVINSWGSGTVNLSITYFVKPFGKWYSTNTTIGGQ